METEIEMKDMNRDIEEDEKETSSFTGIEGYFVIPEWVPTFLRNPMFWLWCLFGCCIKPTENVLKILFGTCIFAFLFAFLIVVVVMIFLDWRQDVENGETLRQILCIVNGTSSDVKTGFGFP